MYFSSRKSFVISLSSTDMDHSILETSFTKGNPKKQLHYPVYLGLVGAMTF